MTENYKIAMKLINEGYAEKHYTFKSTGYIVLDLGGRWCGYIGPHDEYVDVTLDNVHVCSASIDMRYMTVGYRRISRV